MGQGARGQGPGLLESDRRCRCCAAAGTGAAAAGEVRTHVCSRVAAMSCGFVCVPCGSANMGGEWMVS